MMSGAYREIVDFLERSGIPSGDADLAARRCLWSMAKQGVVGYYGGAALGFLMSLGTATTPLAIGGAAVGVGRAALKGQACSEVRDAVRYWLRAY